jgi:geranylgeranyl diphosphate synthase, type II
VVHAAPDIPSIEAARLVQAVMDEYGDLTHRRVQDYLPLDRPGSYLYELLAEYPRRRGKMMRSTLCIAMARTTGSSIDEALATAASIELMHNALLVHDDIEDASAERRGTPTLHTLHGVPLALNAGDAMAVLSLKPLKENLHRIGLATGLRIFEETERMAWESAEGQALELGWIRDNRVDLSEEDYLRMVLKKTCWLATIHPLRVGCLIGARGRLPLDPLVRLGFFLGAAFQIQDDLLSLEGGPQYGKDANGDLLEGKRTLMIIHALRHAAPADRRDLQRYLQAPRRVRNATRVARVRAILERTRALEYARATARGLAGAALFEFDRYFAEFPDSRDVRFMRALAVWVLERRN